MKNNNEENFWTDELVNEFAGYWNDNMNPSKISLSDIEKFKQSKVKKEELKSGDLVKCHGVYIKIMFRNDDTAFFDNGTKAKLSDCEKMNPPTESKITEEPKQWQVYALLGRDTGNLYKLSQDGLYLDKNKNGFSWTPEDKDASIQIYSVIRISDGTVWKLKQTTLHGVIEKISFVDNNLIFGIKNTTIDYLYPLFIHELMEPLKERIIPIKKPEEPLQIKVHDIRDGAGHEVLPTGKYYTLILNQPIPPSKYEPIKKAIESVLNGEWDIIVELTNALMKAETKLNIMGWNEKQGKKYTSDELLEAQHKSFYAGREQTDYIHETGWYMGAKYPTFTDYINSLNK